LIYLQQKPKTAAAREIQLTAKHQYSSD